MATNYDNSARFYDGLARMVFGKTLVNAQVWLLQHIPQNSNILIAGGGTGWILEEIARIRPTGLIITYAEVSAKMMALAQRRNFGENEVSFVCKPVEDLIASQPFDVVITPFLFDSFTTATMKKVFAHLHKLLKPNGLWLYIDFEPTGKWWQPVLLKSMLVFFRILCGIEASALPDVNEEFERLGYSVSEKRRFYGDFVVARVLLKRAD